MVGNIYLRGMQSHQAAVAQLRESFARTKFEKLEMDSHYSANTKYKDLSTVEPKEEAKALGWLEVGEH